VRILFVSERGARAGLLAAVMARAMAPRGVEVVLAARAPGAPDDEAVEALRAVGLDPSSCAPVSLADAGSADVTIVVAGEVPDGALDWREAEAPPLLLRERLRERLATYFRRLED
jgi:hypothetical protein